MVVALLLGAGCVDVAEVSDASGGAGGGGGGGEGGGGAGGAGGGAPILEVGAGDPGGAAISIGAVEDLSLVVRDSFALVAFGRDHAGWFGPAMPEDAVLLPTIVALDVAKISTSRHGVAWLDPAGRAWFLGTAPSSLAAACGSSTPPRACTVGTGPYVALHLGDGHLVALDAAGVAYGAGEGDLGQLGEPRLARAALAPIDLRTAPDEAPFGERITHVRAISGATFLVTERTRRLLRLGDDDAGGDGTPATDDPPVSRPEELGVALVTDCDAVDGPAEAVVARCGGGLVSWGHEILGRLGQDTTDTVIVVSPAMGATAARLVGATPFATFFEDADGVLQSFGAAATICRDLPIEPRPIATTLPGRVGGLPGLIDPVVETAGGGEHTLLRTRRGRLFGCGVRGTGALGPRPDAEAARVVLATELLAR